MIITTAFCDHLKYAVSPTDTKIAFASATGTADACETLAVPNHIFFEVYTAQGSEVVLATGCADGYVTVTRGMSGTTPKSWPVNTCVRVVSINPGLACGTGDTDTDAGGCPCPDTADILSGIQFCENFDVDTSTPGRPTFCLKPTGVVAGSYCNGAFQVNEWGQVTYVAPNFPSSCLPVFDFCCGGSGSGGGAVSLDACDIIYSGNIANHYLQTATLCETLNTIDSLIFALNGMAAPTYNVTTCAPTAGGLEITPIPGGVSVCLPDMALPAGTYGDFTVDAYGRVIGYTDTSVGPYTFTAVLPLEVNVSGTDIEYSIVKASYTVGGYVKLTTLSDIIANTVQPVDLDNALSYQGGLSLIQREAKSVLVSDGITGGGQLVSDVTIGLDFDGLAVGTPDLNAAADYFAFYDGANAEHKKIEASALALVLGAPSAFLHYNPLAGIITQRNIATVTTSGSGAQSYTVTMSTPRPNMSYHVSVSPSSTTFTSFSVHRISTSVFIVDFAVAPDEVTFIVMG